MYAWVYANEMQLSPLEVNERQKTKNIFRKYIFSRLCNLFRFLLDKFRNRKYAFRLLWNHLSLVSTSFSYFDRQFNNTSSFWLDFSFGYTFRSSWRCCQHLCISFYLLKLFTHEHEHSYKETTYFDSCERINCFTANAVILFLSTLFSYRFLLCK